MKKIYFFAMSLALATMVGCQNENDVLNLQNEISNIAFTASFESNDSRTALQGINNNVVWVEGDKLSVFAGKTVNKPYILDKGNGTNYGTFTFDQLSAGTETNNSSSANLSANVAYYPYSQDVTVSESNGSFTFNATFPEKQIYSESGTFGNGASPMVAVTASKLDDNLMFKNVGGVFRVQLIDEVNNGTPAKISKIIINAKDGTKLAGKCEITASNTAVPTVTATEGESSIVLNCADITLSANDNEPTNFVFAMLPVNVSQGNLIISIYDNAGKKMVYEYPEVLDLKRSTAKSTNVLEYDGAHNAITTSAQLQAAFNDNQNGGVVDLTDDMELSEVVTVDQNVTLNLNGKTITGATLQSRASASSDALIVVKRGATLTIEDGTGLGRLDVGEQNSSIWAAVKMTEKGESAKASDASQRAKLIVNGGTIKGYYYGISGNGDRHDTDIEINGGSIEAYCSNDNLGIFHPQNGTLTIKGGTIKGYNSAIEMRAGTLNIEGGNFIAEASPLSVEGAGDGTTTWGAAIAVSQHTTNQQLSVNISGGTFNGYYALNEVDKQDAESSNISLSISGGTFNGSIASANYKGFITGGTFSDPTALYYLGASANVAVNMLADYIGAGFKTQNGQTVTLNIAEGKKYTVTAPLVGSAGTQTLGFQFLQGSNVTIEGKGTITSSEAKMLINNYSNLTLKDITLSPSIPNTMNGQAYYVLSNNCGEVNIEEGTIITAPQGNDSQKVYAFDVCKYSTYPNVTVNVKGGTITGDVEYTGTEGDKQKLVISGGTINGNLVVADSYKDAALTGISITGGAQTGDEWTFYSKQ